MKKSFIFIMLFALSLSVKAEDLSGVWQLVSGEYIDQHDKLINYQDLQMQSIKILTQTHFSFTSMKGDQFWASGTGTYKVSDGKYTETLQYNSFGEKVGAEFTFEFKREGDFWYGSRWKDGKRVEYEVWQKIE